MSAAFRILCVDDDEQMTTLLRTVFERAGLVVECAHDGQAALELIGDDPARFSVIITDHQMPRLSGLALAAHLRALRFPGRIVVHSSQLSPAEDRAYRELAVDYLLAKPTSLTVLLSLVAAVRE